MATSPPPPSLRASKHHPNPTTLTKRQLKLLFLIMVYSLYIYTHQTFEPLLNIILQRAPVPKPCRTCTDSSPSLTKSFWPWTVDAKVLYGRTYCHVSDEEAYANRPPGTGNNESGHWIGDFLMPEPYQCKWECGQCDRIYDSEDDMRYVALLNVRGKMADW
jgi:hypothetical protein